MLLRLGGRESWRKSGNEVWQLNGQSDNSYIPRHLESLDLRGRDQMSISLSTSWIALSRVA